MTFTFADPTQLQLELSASVKSSAWQHSQTIQRAGGRWQAYLNQLCLRTFLPWFQAEIATRAISETPIETPPTCWELVNGSVILIDDIRVALIPVDSIDHDGLEVPQEWVDISELAADYYLAVQVDLDASCLEFWGYATHQMLKSPHHYDVMEYDVMERLYMLSREALIRELDTLWSTLEVYPEVTTKAPIEPLPTLSEGQADNLITRLSNVNMSFARLSVPFVQWGALLADSRWRQRLYRQRLAAWQGTQTASNTASAPTDLRAWFESLQFESLQSMIQIGWQSVEAAFGVEAMRLSESLRGEEPSPTITQVKALTLDGQTLRLVANCQILEDQRVRVQMRLYPAEGETTLPEGVAMLLVSETRETLQEVEARSQDNFIQLKRFKSPVDFSFSVVVSFNDEEKVCFFET